MGGGGLLILHMNCLLCSVCFTDTFTLCTCADINRYMRNITVFLGEGGMGVRGGGVNKQSLMTEKM